ncbi:MAG: metallophosphoesterase [Acetatifactor sp.]
MKVLVIPDVHLKPWMFTRADILLRKKVAEQAVCLMDIPDDWGKEYDIERYEQTYDEAIRFAKEYPQTRWCYGNHDLCYWWNERESGFSSMAAGTVQRKLLELRRVVPEDNPICYVQRIDDVLFSHGGVLDYFVRESVSSKNYHDVDAVVDTINGLGRASMWNDASPIWLRPQYGNMRLYKPRRLLQVVGHTPMEKLERKKNLISCDVFSTYRDGSPIGTQEFLLLDTKTWEYSGVKA